jgi:hypothetical protein
MVGHFEERPGFSPLRVNGAPGLLLEIRGKCRIVGEWSLSFSAERPSRPRRPCAGPGA